MGYSTLPGDVIGYAFVYRDGVMKDLNSFLRFGRFTALSTAAGINDAGQIAGAGGGALLLSPAEIAAPWRLTGSASLSQIWLSWTDLSHRETGFAIERKQSGGEFTPIGQVGANVTQYVDTDLSPNTTYTYRVRTISGTEVSAWCREVDVKTLPDPSAVPTALSAVGISPTRIKVTWNDNSNNEAGFEIERRQSGGEFTVIGRVGANVTQFVDTGLSGTMRYFYRVQAVGQRGDSGWSDEASVIPLPYPPAAPTALTAQALSPTRIDLHWQDNSSDETGFIVERKTPGGSYMSLGRFGMNSNWVIDSGLSPNRAYIYRVRAVKDPAVFNEFPEVSSYPSNEVMARTLPDPPAAPTSLTARVVSQTQIDLQWQDNSSNETGFAIWRKTGSGDFQRCGGVPANVTSFSDRGLTPGVTYTYQVRASNNSGVSDWSNQAEGVTPIPVPAAPSELRLRAASATQVTFSWKDNSSDETGFEIWCKTGGNAYALLATVPANTTLFMDFNLLPSRTYFYRVRAIGAEGPSAWSNEVSWKTPPAP